jgi:hypothetical protein
MTRRLGVRVRERDIVVASVYTTQGIIAPQRTPGITAIDGVLIAPPQFNENKPLRDQRPVTNAIEGAIDIQNAMELQE